MFLIDDFLLIVNCPFSPSSEGNNNHQSSALGSNNSMSSLVLTHLLKGTFNCQSNWNFGLIHARAQSTSKTKFKRFYFSARPTKTNARNNNFRLIYNLY